MKLAKCACDHCCVSTHNNCVGIRNYIDTAICVPACQNGGICTHPNTCQCSGEYTGSTCQTREQH